MKFAGWLHFAAFEKHLTFVILICSSVHTRYKVQGTRYKVQGTNISQTQQAFSFSSFIFI